MPSIIPSYVYTLFASIIVGTLIITMAGLAVASLKREAENQTLARIAEYVAAESVELASHSTADNLISTVRLDMPSTVGSQRYWVQLRNDSAKTWVEVGYGATVISSDEQVRLPLNLEASGTFVSGAGAPFLKCYSDEAGVHLNIYGGN